MHHQVDVIQRKIELELTNSSTVGNINDSAYLKSTKPVEQAKQAPVQSSAIDKKFDWYQNASFIFISYKVSSQEVSQQTEVNFDEQAITLRYNDQVITLELTNKIVPAESQKQSTPKKIELKLKKAIENANWMGVEKGGEAKLLATAVS